MLLPLSSILGKTVESIGREKNILHGYAVCSGLNVMFLTVFKTNLPTRSVKKFCIDKHGKKRPVILNRVGRTTANEELFKSSLRFYIIIF